MVDSFRDNFLDEGYSDTPIARFRPEREAKGEFRDVLDAGDVYPDLDLMVGMTLEEAIQAEDAYEIFLRDEAVFAIDASELVEDSVNGAETIVVVPFYAKNATEADTLLNTYALPEIKGRRSASDFRRHRKLKEQEQRVVWNFPMADAREMNVQAGDF